MLRHQFPTSDKIKEDRCYLQPTGSFLDPLQSVCWTELSPHSQCPEPRQQRRVIFVWLEPITYFRLQPTCPGISWRSTRTSSHFSTGVCHLHISINWLEYRKRSADIKIESDSVQLKGWKWEHLLVRAGPSDENLRLVPIRNGTSGPLLWSKYLNKPSSRLVSCNL